LQNGTQISLGTISFLSLDLDEVGVINYEITPINTDAKLFSNLMWMLEFITKMHRTGKNSQNH
jgi:hypothetical protein